MSDITRGDERKAFKAGAAMAQTLKGSRMDNPHPNGSTLARAWAQGFKHGAPE